MLLKKETMVEKLIVNIVAIALLYEDCVAQSTGDQKPIYLWKCRPKVRQMQLVHKIG